MITLGNIDHVKQLKADLAAAFDGERGARLMEFMELVCNYDTPGYNPEVESTIFLSAGKREVLMTLKAILKYRPEEVVEYFKKMEL